MDNVRIYLLSAGQHGPAAFPPAQTIGQQKNNPLDYRWAMKALLLAMDRWTANGTAPPPSRYPRIADGTLVAPDKLQFPKLAGVATTTRSQRAYRADYGPRFATEGVVTLEPPRIGKAFPMLVPQVDADGNGIAGIRMPELAVPLATYTGWNLFNDRSGPTACCPACRDRIFRCRDRRREETEERSARVDRRALSGQGSVRRRGDEGGAGSRRSGLPAGRGCPAGRQNAGGTGTTSHRGEAVDAAAVADTRYARPRRARNRHSTFLSGACIDVRPFPLRLRRCACDRSAPTGPRPAWLGVRRRDSGRHSRSRSVAIAWIPSAAVANVRARTAPSGRFAADLDRMRGAGSWHSADGSA